MEKYVLVSSEYADNVSHEVNILIEKGYVPFEGPSAAIGSNKYGSTRLICQAMIYQEVPDTNTMIPK